MFVFFQNVFATCDVKIEPLLVSTFRKFQDHMRALRPVEKNPRCPKGNVGGADYKVHLEELTY